MSETALTYKVATLKRCKNTSRGVAFGVVVGVSIRLIYVIPDLIRNLEIISKKKIVLLFVSFWIPAFAGMTKYIK
jgi:hypothetical protein